MPNYSFKHFIFQHLGIFLMFFVFEISISKNNKNSLFIDTSTTMDKNNEKNEKFYRKVAFLMFTEMVNFRPQS